MSALRRLILAHRHLAAVICVAALALKLLVPTGYMVASERFAITLCSGATPQSASVVMPGTRGDMPDHGRSTEHGKEGMPCAFSGLSAPALGAIDPLPPIAAISFAMAVGLRLVRSLFEPTSPYRRPPSRGPPAFL